MKRAAERESSRSGDCSRSNPRPLANALRVERKYTPDRRAMLAALRVVLAIPHPLPAPGRRDSDGQ